MKFKYFMIVALLFSSLYIQANNVPGEPFNRVGGTRQFNETDIKQFHFEIDHNKFQNLVNMFESDPNTGQFEIAGFCFIPIMEQVPNALTRGYNFKTTGFRVVLTLWKDNGNNPSIIKFYGFSDLGDALDPNANLPAANMYFEETINTSSRRNGASVVSNYTPDNVITNSREFDLVFLDYDTYQDLATSGKWYINRNRPANAKGIMLERYVNSFKNLAGEQEHYRSLIFRPILNPNLIDEDSEAGLAYAHGYYCPPFWREDGILAEAVGKSLVEGIRLSNIDSVIALEKEIEAFEGKGIFAGLSLLQIVSLIASIGTGFFVGRKTNLFRSVQ